MTPLNIDLALTGVLEATRDMVRLAPSGIPPYMWADRKRAGAGGDEPLDAVHGWMQALLLVLDAGLVKLGATADERRWVIGSLVSEALLYSNHEIR